MTTKNFVVKNGLTTGNIILDASSSNITANVVVANLSVPATANLGAVGNITITGGTSGQVLRTNGSGVLSWVDQSGGGGVNSYASITVDNFTGNGVQTDFTLSVTPSSESDITVNYNGALQLHSAYTLSGSTLTMSEAPSNGSYLEVTSITGLVAGTGASFTTHDYTGDGSETDFTVTNGATVSSVLVTENGVLQVPTTDYTISGTTLTFTTAPANGVKIQIRELTVAVASSTYANSNVATYLASFGSNIITTTGNITANYFIGNGSQLTGLPASYANSNVASYLPTYTGNVSADYFIGNGSTLTNITGSNVSGQVSNAVVAGTVYTNAQPNITSVGTLASVTVTGLTTATGGVKTANILDTSGTVTLQTKYNSVSGDVGVVGNLVVGTGGTGNITATYLIGNGSQLTGLPASYANSNVASYLPTFTGNVGANYFVGNGATLGSIANLRVTGGSSGQVIITDGAGNLSFSTPSSGVTLGKTVALNMFLGF